METKTIAFAALFAVFTAVGAFIKIPIPYIPFTLQILSVYLAGALLGPKVGSLSQLCYILIGLTGYRSLPKEEAPVIFLNRHLAT